MRNLLACIVLLLTIVTCLRNALAEEGIMGVVPDRYGLAMVLGNTYDPTNDIRFFLVSGFALYDYDRVWRHPAPEALRFKVECSAGATTTKNRNRFMVSVDMLALYYLDDFALSRLRPYVEAGIGIIYTDFQVEGQGLRINFNPQAGVGIEFVVGSGEPFFAAIRLHHVSNGGLDEDNRGINSFVLMLGRFF